MREVRLYDTRSGKLQLLEPRDPGRVGIYACGPTVYGRIHLGNARPFVIFSLMKHFLEHDGYDVTLVINITDVNDKIYEAAQAAGVPSARLAREMTRAYIADTDALELGRPDYEPLASESMEEIVSYIQALIDSGHAYAAPYEDGADVFFRVRSDPAYGSLSHRRLGEMDQGEGIEGSERKHDPLDFALWKAHKPQEDTFWSSPWGDGRPGWHIECSAMAEELLGDEFDIHGGGSDLVFPHHENEAAQTRTARGCELARLWVHNGMVQSVGEKMAKSVGNIAPLYEVLERYGRDAVVMYLASGHYRQPLAYSQIEMKEAVQQVLRIREALRRMIAGEESPAEMAPHKEAFFAALADDFNTPKALASLFAWVREANRREEPVGERDLREMLDALGLGGLLPLQAVDDIAALDPRAGELVELREAARAQRDFGTADRLREEIAALGFEVRDGPGGPELIPNP
jgi:cysteinyl-tRNA synthetase